LSFSERPLRFAISLGILISFLSLVLTAWIVYKSIFYDFSVTGWASVISAIFFSSGITLVVLGISGIYLGEIFKQVKNRPLYIIEQIHKK
jgi:dolichol-phosphate mannosyltransferase